MRVVEPKRAARGTRERVGREDDAVCDEHRGRGERKTSQELPARGSIHTDDFIVRADPATVKHGRIRDELDYTCDNT